jgi:hypothetical protein
MTWWALVLAFLWGGLVGAAMLALLTRSGNDERALAHWRDRQSAVRFYSLLRYTTERGMRCPSGADFNAWLRLVEVAMVKAEADKVAGEQ